MSGPEHDLKLLNALHSIQSMLIHQPTDTERIVWYGGDSTQLHYEVLKGKEWKELDVRSFMEFPKSTKELKQEVVEYYNYISPEVQANYVEYDY